MGASGSARHMGPLPIPTRVRRLRTALITHHRQRSVCLVAVAAAAAAAAAGVVVHQKPMHDIDIDCLCSKPYPVATALYSEGPFEV